MSVLYAEELHATKSAVFLQRGAGTMMDKCPLRRTPLLFNTLQHGRERFSPLRSALWAVSMACQAPTSASARVGVLLFTGLFPLFDEAHVRAKESHAPHSSCFILFCANTETAHWGKVCHKGHLSC